MGGARLWIIVFSTSYLHPVFGVDKNVDESWTFRKLLEISLIFNAL